jgi:hypothetical protein
MPGEALQDYKNTNAAQNKWIADISLSRMSVDFKDISLHLANFSIPELLIGSTSIQYKGTALEIPTKVIQPENRTITFSYMIDISWDNYFALYQWANLIGTTENVLPNTLPINLRDEFLNKTIKAIPIYVYLLSEYKKPILKITYDNCWIKSFSELSLSYQEEPDVIKHSFTIAYSNFKLEKITS